MNSYISTEQPALSNNFAQVQSGTGTDNTWNWGWGDEDNSNLQAPLQSGANSNTTLDSFCNDTTWEWSIGDNNLAAGDNKIEEQNEQLFPKVGVQNKQKMTHLSAARNENLTPQWSMESQMSQDSSEDIDRKLSRSSTISQSPLSGHDATNFEVALKSNDSNEVGGNRENLSNEKKANLSLPPQQNKEGANVSSYKQTLGFSHRAANKFSNNVEANLETLPDNSEQPDLPQKKPPVKRINSQQPQQWQENIEVAPINDRNQYLETGQLSDIDLNHSSDTSSNNLQQESVDTLPPPGLRRMVLGQNERITSTTNEEPPPGLSRMVLGQTENTTTNELPLGVRMIPGESSSPETTQYPQSYVSEVELASAQPRSATIGADTPPNVNRSETIGSDDFVNQVTTEVNRRQSIEGQPEDTEVSALTNTVRDLTVGENTTDGTNSVERKTSRQESSDSERERDTSPRDRRGRNRHEDRAKQGRNRYSPDTYKDKRGRYRDRRYEEDTDYYSERERERRNREEYERKYGSLRREKEKERRRRERQDYERGGRRDYYYGRYEDDYENDTRFVGLLL